MYARWHIDFDVVSSPSRTLRCKHNLFPECLEHAAAQHVLCNALASAFTGNAEWKIFEPGMRAMLNWFGRRMTRQRFEATCMQGAPRGQKLIVCRLQKRCVSWKWGNNEEMLFCVWCLRSVSSWSTGTRTNSARTLCSQNIAQHLIGPSMTLSGSARACLPNALLALLAKQHAGAQDAGAIPNRLFIMQRFRKLAERGKGPEASLHGRLLQHHHAFVKREARPGHGAWACAHHVQQGHAGNHREHAVSSRHCERACCLPHQDLPHGWQKPIGC